jgi:thiamine biosynthesis protein ThiS
LDVTVNGEGRRFDQPLTVEELVRRLDLTPQRVAVEVNERLVKRERYSHTTLRDGDRIEIVTLVGGG